MKIQLLIIYISIISCILYSNNDQFEKYYPLHGIGNITDQAMIRSPEGDDYFFGIVDNNLIMKKRVNEENYFEDFYLDVSHLGITKITEVECVNFSNDLDKIFFVAETLSGDYGIFSISFIDDILVVQNIIYHEEIISRLNMKYFEFDQAITSYSLNGDLKLALIDISDAINYFDVDINGDYYDIELNLSHTDDSCNLEFYYFTHTDEQYNLWFIGYMGSEITTQFVKNLSLLEVENFNRVIDNNTALYSTEDVYRTYFRVIDNTCKYLIFNDNDEKGFYETESGINYAFKIAEDYYYVQDFEKLPEEIISESTGTQFIDNRAHIKLIDNSLEITTIDDKSIYDLSLYDEYIIIGRILITIKDELSHYAVELSYISDNSLEKLSSINIDYEFVHIVPQFITEDLLLIQDSTLFIDLRNFTLHEFSSKPFVHKNYIYYLTNSNDMRLGVRR